MNRQQKETQINQLKDDFSISQASFLVSFKGMPVAKLQELRKELRSAGGKLKVAKMRLVKKAVQSMDGLQELTPFLKQQLGVVFSKDDATVVAKTLHQFAKKNEKLDLLVIGTLDKKLLNKSEIEEIATLPSRDVLLAQLCYVLQASVIQTVMTLDQLAKQRSSGESENAAVEQVPAE